MTCHFFLSDICFPVYGTTLSLLFHKPDSHVYCLHGLIKLLFCDNVDISTMQHNIFYPMLIPYLHIICQSQHFVMFFLLNYITWSAVRSSDYESKEPGFKPSCCRFEALAISFAPHGISCLNEHLVVDICERVVFVL